MTLAQGAVEAAPLRWLKAPWRRLRRLLARRRHAATRSELARRVAARAPRLLAIGHFRFPVYSQGFVYQELASLAAAGFDLRVAASARGPRRELAERFRPLAARRVALEPHRAVGAAELARYRKLYPRRVDALLADLERASGLGEAELVARGDVLRAFAFARLAESFRAEYLHSYFFYEGALAAWVASRLLDLPRGLTAYADHRLRDYPLKLAAEQVASAALPVATSRRIAAELVELAPAAAERILVKPNSVDCDVFRAQRRAPSVGGRPLRLLAVSRIDPKKGLTDLLEAMARLRREGLALELEIAGTGDGSESSRAEESGLRARLAEPELAGAVRLPGVLDERGLLAAFARADLFVAPSVERPDGDRDGIPTSLLEAMATALPSIGTDAGSLAEAIDPDETGLLVPQRDPAALAAAIAELAADGARRVRLGQAAAASVRDRFASARVEPLLHERLRALLS